MPKQRKIEKPEIDDFPFLLDDELEDEVFNDIFANMVTASHNQMQIALKLTELVTEKSSPANINEERVLNTFKQAMKTVGECSPVQALWEKLHNS